MEARLLPLAAHACHRRSHSRDGRGTVRRLSCAAAAAGAVPATLADDEALEVPLPVAHSTGAFRTMLSVDERNSCQTCSLRV